MTAKITQGTISSHFHLLMISLSVLFSVKLQQTKQDVNMLLVQLSLCHAVYSRTKLRNNNSLITLFFFFLHEWAHCCKSFRSICWQIMMWKGGQSAEELCPVYRWGEGRAEVSTHSPRNAETWVVPLCLIINTVRKKAVIENAGSISTSKTRVQLNWILVTVTHCINRLGNPELLINSVHLLQQISAQD